MDTTATDHNIWPLLTSIDALALREFFKELGFREGVLVAEGAVVHHSEMIWPEGGRVMICTAEPGGTHQVEPGSGGIYIVTDHPDEVYRRAQDLGAPILRELGETDYGSRDFSIATAEGHGLSFGTYAGEPA